ncbi:hypothetical protein D1872_230430 [compost metagenome]
MFRDFIRVHMAVHPFLAKSFPQEGIVPGKLPGSRFQPLLPVGFLLQFPADLTQHALQLGRIGRLEDVIFDLKADGFLGVSKFIMSGNDDDFAGGEMFTQLLHQTDAVQNRHVQIDEHDMNAMPQRQFERFFAVLGLRDDPHPQFGPADAFSDAFADNRFVVGDQHLAVGEHGPRVVIRHLHQLLS